MFKSKKYLLLVVMILVLLCIPAYADWHPGIVATVGGIPDSGGNYDISINSLRQIYFNGGKMAKYENATTNDTLTIAESGKTIVVDGDATVSPTTYFILPTAEPGLEYTFVVGAEMTTTASGADLPDLNVNPQDDDTILGMVNSVATNTYDAGDSVNSAGVTGDSITLISYKWNYWQAVGVRGTWSDAD